MKRLSFSLLACEEQRFYVTERISQSGWFRSAEPLGMPEVIKSRPPDALTVPGTLHAWEPVPLAPVFCCYLTNGKFSWLLAFQPLSQWSDSVLSEQ